MLLSAARFVCLSILGIAALIFPVIGQSADKADRLVVVLTIEGAIGPAVQDYVERSLEVAVADRAELVVIRMDTPGGLDSSTRGIVKSITNSPVPVASYVAPAGARAASAGTYILYASHVAAMAPGTNLGAATPVQMGGLPTPMPSPKDDGKQDGESSKDADTTESGSAMQNKIINDAVAYIRGLAQLHDRNADWAEQAVRKAASIPSAEALELNVIDIVASGMGDLLAQADGQEVKVQGEVRTLQTAGALIRAIEPDWRSRLLNVITNPNVAYILMLVGIYGLIFEFSNPGAIVPGTVGAISLLLALYALQMLPINYAGMGLILLGVALMIAEAFAPSFGVLGIGGVVAFVIGSIILMDTQVPGFGIDISIIITFAVLSVLVFVFVIGMAIRARRHPVVSGQDELVGGTATVLADFQGSGSVNIHSETWQASSAEPLRRGQRVRVTGIDGLTLHVEPLNSSTRE